MGAGIAQICAMAGSQVFMQDVKQEFLDRGMESVRSFLAKGIDKGKVTESQRDSALQLLEPKYLPAAASKFTVSGMPASSQYGMPLLAQLARLAMAPPRNT